MDNIYLGKLSSSLEALHIPGLQHLFLVSFEVIPLAEVISFHWVSLTYSFFHFLLRRLELRALLKKPVAREH